MKGHPRFITEDAGVPLDADLFMNSISASGVRDAAQLKQQPDQCSVNNERWHCDVRLSSRELSLWLDRCVIINRPARVRSGGRPSAPPKQFGRRRGRVARFNSLKKTHRVCTQSVCQTEQGPSIAKKI